MTSPTPSPAPTTPTMCARHPDVETGLACGRCGTPICPRCLVYTPAGTRCPDCGRAPTLPIHRVGVLDALRIAGVALPLAVMLGIVGALLLPPRSGGSLLMFLVALAAGSAAGTLMATAIMRVSRKRGPRVVAIAGAALLLMSVVRFVGGGGEAATLFRDFAGAILLFVAVSAASSRLR